ncbi:hypothetical protein [Streptomyces sp. NPDC086519]|uniref:hypothetical protein n=1 Tax=Streptomyces sp. NPDC086519 TaxID=3154863 RepID=UPI00342363CB
MHFSVFLVGRSLGPADDPFTAYAPTSGDPLRFAVYLASRTQNVHHGFSVTTLPLHRPVRLAEHVNLLDHGPPQGRGGPAHRSRRREPSTAFQTCLNPYRATMSHLRSPAAGDRRAGA